MKQTNTKYRHEYKISLNQADYITLRQRLRAVLPHDANVSGNGEYHIRSIYFDTPDDKALREKLEGVNRREKYRIRFYNLNTTYIRIEKKSKISGLGYKLSAKLTEEQVLKIVKGDIEWMRFSPDLFLQEFYAKMRFQLLKPKTIVDYMREPFMWGPGNVRITLDRDIRTGVCNEDLFTEAAVTIPIVDDITLLEVKYDEFLPDFIRDLVQLQSRKTDAFSKYAACRAYG